MGQNRTKRATVRDVARYSGVSVATVSRVLNGQSGFSAETEQTVRRTIEELGYHYPRDAAGSESRNRTNHSIALIVPEINDYVFASMTKSIETSARERGYAVMICHSGSRARFGEDFVDLLGQYPISGILALSIQPDSSLYRKVQEASIPCVIINSISYDCTFPYVKIDDFQAMYTATKFLLDRGHREIAILSGEMGDPVAGWPRLEGYRQALREAHISPDPSLEAYASDFGYDSGTKAFTELIARGVSFTGLVTCSDVVAAAAIRTAAQNGIRVPEDLSIVGFDNSQIASLLNPPLTSVAQPFDELGETAVHLLVRAIEQGKPLESRVFPTHVIERETTRSLLSE